MNLNFNRVFIKDINNTQSYYTVEKNELYLNIIGYNAQMLNTAVIYFDITYNDYLKVGSDITIGENGEPCLLFTNDAYLYGVSVEKVDFNDRDRGFQYLNTTITPARPVWWTGNFWVDAMGTILNLK